MPLIHTVRLGLGCSAFLVAYIGAASLIVDLKTYLIENPHSDSFNMHSPLLAVRYVQYNADSYNKANSDVSSSGGYWNSSSDPYSTTPSDNSGYYQNQWYSTNPSAGFGYWSHGQWIMTQPKGQGYWHNGQWVTTTPSGSGFWQFGTWVDTPETKSEIKADEEAKNNPK